MKIGLWTGFFLLEKGGPDPLRTVMENVQRIRHAGFLCGEMDERNAFNLFVDCDEEECLARAKILAELRFFTQLHAPKPSTDIIAQKLMERRILQACSIMDVGTIVTHPYVPTQGRAEPKVENLELLRRFCGEAGLKGLHVALENQIYSVDMDYYLAKVPSLGVNLDFAHALASGLDVPDLISRYGSLLYGLHVADSDGRREDYHIVPGKGALDWRAVFTALRQARYAGDLHLEIVHERDERPELNDMTAESAYVTTAKLMEAYNI